MSIQSIHIVGAQETNYPWGFENRIIEALGRMGVKVISTDYRKRRAELPDLIRQPVDLVLVCRGEGIPPEVIRQAPCPVALWYAEQIGARTQTDATANQRRRELAYNVQAFDYVFSHDQGNLDVFRAMGARNISWLPTATVDPQVHRKLDVPKTRDVIFAGRVTPRRERILREIERDGYKLEILNIWDPVELNRAFNESRVVLNLHLSDLPNTETRIAEVLGAGSFLLSETVSSLDFVRDAEHCGLARTGSVDELIAKLAYYLKHEEDREAIASCGHVHMLAHHSIEARLEEMMTFVRSNPVARKPASHQGASQTVRHEAALAGIPASERPAVARATAAPAPPARSRWPIECGVLFDASGSATQDLDAFYSAVAFTLKRPAAPAASGNEAGLDTYRNDGWGLSRAAFSCLDDLIKRLSGDRPLNVVEFGSGVSTQFLADQSRLKGVELHVTSFDDSLGYCFQHTDQYDFIDLHVRPLEECSREHFEDMFSRRTYDESGMRLRTEAPHSRQQNCFYRLEPGDLNEHYDLVILDGPNGNGRSIAFLHLKDRLKPGAHVFIDDFTHYDFIDRLKTMFECEEVCRHEGPGGRDKWNNGGAFALFRIKGPAVFRQE